MSKGKFIAIEGIDKSGKTTLANLLSLKLTGAGVENLVTREPWHPLITRVIHETTSEGVDGYAEALLFAADRLLHLKRLISPVLAKGKWVITDRYVYSSIAYQTARGAEEDWVMEINKHAITPDLTILLDIDPSEAEARSGDDRLMALENRIFSERIRRIYLELARKYGFLVLDALKKPESLVKQVFSELKRRGWV
ncbi:MAG: dTMP kinase [Desulfurococcales archaeon]|nr:dTMP kinase [Desulfurococcales archaeon]